ncbi:hypothetical protein [Rhodococcus koreensis]|uniref:hypothetical protein n=1 Tax=Rhodococcus koreensis TaxID=99653 RepID=UPI0036DA8987
MTRDAVALRGAEILVMTSADHNTGGDLIASYPPAAQVSPEDVLPANGWRVADGATSEVEGGYRIVAVEAVNWEQIIEHVRGARAQAKFEATRRDRAWRDALQGALLAGGSASRLSAAAGVSRERAYQIRDGRR